MADKMLATPVAKPVEIFVDTRGALIIDEEGGPDQRDSRDIYLPNHVESVSHIAVDIGGSLAKVVYFTRSLAATSTNASPVIGTQTLEPEPFHNRLAELQSSGVSAGAESPRRGAFPEHSRESSTGGLASHPASSPTSSAHHGTFGAGGASGASTAMPRSPSSSSFLHGGGRSGTLTPTAVLRERAPSATSIGYVPAMHSSFLKRRSLPAALPGGRLNFIKFETEHIHDCVAFLNELIDRSAQAHGVDSEQMRKGVQVMATGGGAHMFYDLFERELGVEVRKEDEMGCLITGLNFITLIPDEVFWYSDELVSALHQPLPMERRAAIEEGKEVASAAKASPHAAVRTNGAPGQQAAAGPQPLPRPSPNPPLYEPVFDSHPSPKLPCLLVNIGSGVSIIKVDDYGKYERVSGTSLGGGTLWGLLSLLTDAGSFDEMLELSEKGDNASVDMLVGDIYGSGVGGNALNSFGLKSSTIASSFGKVFRKDGSQREGAEGRKRRFKAEDICRSLLYAISNNIGQIAYMNAEKYDLDRIYFGGCFIRGHRSTISTLSYAIRFWSKGTKRAFFLRHEGYLGAVGAWIKHISIADPPLLQQPPAVAAVPAAAGYEPGRSATAIASGAAADAQSSACASRAARVPPSTLPVTVLTDTVSAPLVSPPLSDFEGQSLGGHSLPSLLAEALGPIAASQVSSPSPTSTSTATEHEAAAAPAPPASRIPDTSKPQHHSMRNGHDAAAEQPLNGSIGAGAGAGTGVAVAPALPRIPLKREHFSAGTSGDDTGAEAGEGDEDEEADSLDGLLASLSPSDRAILAPVLKELDGPRGSGSGSGLGSSATGDEDAHAMAELLARLEAADLAADGLESKLDVLLSQLDGALGLCGAQEAGDDAVQSDDR
ncbi:fumble-domain-containing protein [Tilletiaria anomala UBC 951]|uniref:Fumble-domain-containing protein n=1 Tax=Tilletiaria anomala (strain ATCC 24038 / CBS 436.72 / UBC 951) TaxID=1037660 RepID=A0A066WNA0_TILAU|nr:fumble-domain-containing protein [Tilletiaria anomala UBC 951]KDN52105.1 fumble-domain-containing protein [Tilletiaria anomala UBC 951]